MADWVGPVDAGWYRRNQVVWSVLPRFLTAAAVEVVEVDRQNRQVRRKKGKSDPADAVTTPHEPLCPVLPKRCDGPVNRYVSSWRLAGRLVCNAVRA